MASVFITPELIEACRQALMSAGGIVFNLFKPYITTAIISSIIFLVLRKVVNFCYLISGNSSCKAKKKSKQLCDGINAVSSLYDIYKK